MVNILQQKRSTHWRDQIMNYDIVNLDVRWDKKLREFVDYNSTKPLTKFAPFKLNSSAGVLM